MNNNIILNEKIKIEDMIYEIRGKQVMLDSDLAKLYECKNGTKEINQAVKNNLEKFPERYAFRITEEETANLKSKIFTSSYGGSRKGHTVFTEQGVAMLATILHTKVATQVSIKIMDAFVSMRKYISSISLEQNFINNLVLEDHDKIKLLENIFQKFEEKEKKNDLYFSGQVYDAYYRVYEIFNKATSGLIVIDPYADNKLLDIIKRLKVNVIIITKSNNLLTKQDIEIYSKQYNNLKVIYNNTFHDRFFIIDKEIIYHCGTSINSLGYKTFSINLFEELEISKLLIDKVNDIIEGK